MAKDGIRVGSQQARTPSYQAQRSKSPSGNTPAQFRHLSATPDAAQDLGESVGVSLSLAEDYDALVSDSSKLQQYNVQLKTDIARALGYIPRTLAPACSRHTAFSIVSHSPCSFWFMQHGVLQCVPEPLILLSYTQWRTLVCSRTLDPSVLYTTAYSSVFSEPLLLLVHATRRTQVCPRILSPPGPYQTSYSCVFSEPLLLCRR